VLLALLLAFLISPALAQEPVTLKFTNLAFRLNAYGTVIAFSQDIYCTQLAYEYSGTFTNNTAWIFQNLKMDGETIPQWKITVVGGNVTITRLFRDKVLAFTVSGPTGKTYTVSFTSPYGRPASVKKNGQTVEELKGWSIAGDTLIFQGAFASTDSWEVSWIAPSEEVSGGTPTIQQPPSQAPLLPPPEELQKAVERIQGAGLIIIAVVVAAFFLYGEYRERPSTRSLSDKWKNRKSRKVRWKRKKTWD
jgi:hypothetical protein